MKVCVTVDMDNHCDYRSLIDPDGDRDGASFYQEAVPRFLDLFDRFKIRATFFAIGRDTKSLKNASRLREIASRGHEIGNHSHTHPYHFRRLSREEKRQEIERAENSIADAVGVRPVGFRAPSGEVDAECLELISERGYRYDSSITPTAIGWAFMVYGRLVVRHPNYRLGSPMAVFAPNYPYFPRAGAIFRESRRRTRAELPAQAELPLLEIPVSVFPRLGIPFYATLLRIFGGRAFDWLLRGQSTSFVRLPRSLCATFHLIDLIDHGASSLGDAVRRSPGLSVAFERRERFVAHALKSLSRTGECVPMRELAEAHHAEFAAGAVGRGITAHAPAGRAGPGE